METCPCGSELNYSECCELIIKGEKNADTAEQLMRSRYSAYAKMEIPYIYTSLHPDHRKDYNEKSTRAWAANSQWHNLEINETYEGTAEDTVGQVEFTAIYSENSIKKKHHEMAYFKKEDDTWYFVDGKAVAPKQFVRTSPKVGRNDSCPCGSGKKFKKCCG
jgi:SEC-C motif-containing protein